jgi:hypothetical protein
MRDLYWLLRSFLVVAALLPACGTKSHPAPERRDAGRDSRPVTGCKSPEGDRSCNDDADLPGVAGQCQADGTCACRSGFVLNPNSKRCRLDKIADAGIVVHDGAAIPGRCTPGADQTCNDDPLAAYAAGTCLSTGSCSCRGDYVINPATGRCAPAPKDAGRELASRDTAPDIKVVCNQGKDETCNDDVLAQVPLGVCQANNSCLCNSGYVINANTGRCALPAASACVGTYRACGCQCCEKKTPSVFCYYANGGESLASIKAADEATKSDPACEAASCRAGELYQCCVESSPEPAGSAEYNVLYSHSAPDDADTTGDLLVIQKAGKNGDCSSFDLYSSSYRSSEAVNRFRVITPTAWRPGLVSELWSVGVFCEHPAENAAGIGAQGTVTLTRKGTSCSLSAHLSLFYFGSRSTSPITRRIDVDDLTISGPIPSEMCQ